MNFRIIILFFVHILVFIAESKSSKEVFVFSTDKSNWKFYDWNKISTIVEFGYHDDLLVEYAHKRNVKVVSVANFEKRILKDANLINNWVKNTLSSVQINSLDGVNIDFEDEINCSDVESRKGFNDLVHLLAIKLKQHNPGSQLSIDFAWSSQNIDNRCYDYTVLADLVDVVFIMSYDERSQILGECKAWANSAYQETLRGVKSYIGMGVEVSKMILGVPWYGYDYPCEQYDKQSGTCTLKRVPFRNVTCSDAAGVQVGYTDILTLLTSTQFPTPSSSFAVSSLFNSQKSYPSSDSFSASSSSSTSSLKSNLKFKKNDGKIEVIFHAWDADALSPYFTYKILESGKYHQVWYDNAISLKIKYLISEALALRGVGFWEADSLRYDATEQSKVSVQEMWGAL